MKTGPGRKVLFKLPFETSPERPIELAAYVTDRGGTVVAASPIKDGRFELDVDEVRAHELRLSVAPVRKDLGDRLPTQGQLERLQAYNPTFTFDPQRREYELNAIPVGLVKIWWLCACRVRGRVVKPVASGGVSVDMPVCHARVHICEMDPFWLVLRRLGEPEIFRLRDDLLAALARPFPVPPEPDPGPPRSFARIAPVALEGLERQSAASLLGLAESGPPSRAISRTASSRAANPAPALGAAGGLALETHVALASPAVTSVRAALLANVHLIRPYLCWWRWLWPWFWRCDEVRVVETDDNGRFDVTIYHRCDDEPDLYFWVEYFLAGAWTPVYQPWRVCATHWDFDCTSEVTIRIADPRVPYCGGLDSPEGKVVVIKTIGNDVSISEILGAGAGAREGLVSGGSFAGQDSPFAGTLELRSDFGEQLFASGVTRYRWSYRQIQDVAGTAVADGPHVMTRQVVRHYRTWSGGNPVDLPHQLGLLPGNFFEVWNPVTSSTPVGDHNWQVDDAHEDLVSGFFETGPLDATRTRDTSLAGHHVDDQKAGLYELTLELFHADGSLVDWTAEGIGLFEANVPAPFGVGPMTTQPSPAEHRVLNGAGDTMGFRLHVFVDNSFCEAQIFDVTAPAPSGPCGFIDYVPGTTTAHVSFQARHGHQFAAFWFEVDKGSSGEVAPASVPAWAPVGLSPVNGFVRDAISNWAKDVPITGPGSLVDSPTPCPDGRAAFAETIYVAATATDGWQRASWLDASATPKAFALNPAH
jgi:hypothetical protein